MWADASFQGILRSTAPNQFLIRAGGGVGINTNRPQTALHVAGEVTATGFHGGGAGLAGVNADRLDGHDSTEFALAAHVHSAADVTTGTLADARLSNNVPLEDTPNTFTALNTFSPASGAPFAVGGANKVANLNADLLDGLDSTSLWRTAGNSGTTPGQHFLGTTDNQPLELKANNARALRLEPAGSNSVNVVGGCAGNWVKPGVVAATIAGGGAGDYAGAAYTNRVEADAGTIGGGGGNAIRGGSLYAIIGGGVLNMVESGAQFAAITGGSLNTIGTGASGATIAGGVGNLVGTNAQYAMIPGGASCTVTGAYAFAAGRRAKALHPGAFVWADNQDADLVSLTNNHVRFRCQHGVRFSSGGGAANQNVFWNPGDAGWSVSSDRHLKENFLPVDPQAVLDRLARLPIAEWNFTGHPQRHLGPTAQDFHAAFPFTESDTTIDTGDLHGVALTAIQGLNRKVEEKTQRLAAENQALKQEVAELKALVRALAAKTP